LNGHIQCLTVRYDTCKVDGDSCVNTPVVIFVEQMSIAQNTILAVNYCLNGKTDFQNVFMEIRVMEKGSFSFQSQNRRTLLLPPR